MISEIYAFGEPDPASVIAQKTPQDIYVGKDIQLTIRCDIRHVLKSFEEKGYYVTKTGEKIQAENFFGVILSISFILNTPLKIPPFSSSILKCLISPSPT